MRRYYTSSAMVACGTLLILIGLSMLPGQMVASAAPPRPPLSSTVVPDRDGGGSSAAEPGAGRLTGTVIDLTTSAPAPGIAVSIGELLVMSDSNGNYDHWVATGTYTVAMVLSVDQGVAELPAQRAEVLAEQTTVLHLNFRSPVAAAAAAAPAPAVAPAPTPTPAPTAVPLERSATAADQPARLPPTGDESSGWVWVVLGMLLMAGGVGLGIFPRLVRVTAVAVAGARDSRALLRTLLIGRQTTSSDEQLLGSLLRGITRRRPPDE